MIRAEKSSDSVLPERILCLANSYKHGNRCVAGISISTKKWVRLIGHRVAGCLTREESCYGDGTEVAILDVFEAKLGKECGSVGHPEDVYVVEGRWRHVRRFDSPSDAEFLAGFVDSEPIVLQGYCDRIIASRFEKTAAKCSLGLVRPDDLWWWIREENGKRRNRAIFRLGKVGRIRYDLAVTDPVWLDKLHSSPVGIHPHTHFYEDKPPKTLLTVSLSEPFEGFHYKLVAGVVCLPAWQRSFQSSFGCTGNPGPLDFPQHGHCP
jgi:hypothetical protein